MRPIRPFQSGRVVRGTALATFATFALAVLAACGEDQTGDGGGATGATGGTMVLSTAGDADLLLPPFMQVMSGRQAADMLFDHLAEVPDDLTTVGDKGYAPRLAKQWSWAPDSLSIAFQVDERARWHDGRPVRASDVKYSIDLSRDSTVGSPVVGALAAIDSVSVRDSLTAVVWFERRSPTQFYDLVYNVWIIPEHVYGAVPRAQLRTSELARRPVGSGRFRFGRWDAGSRIEVVADTANYRGRARLDRIIWSIAPDPGTALTRVVAGEADMYEVVPTAAAGQFAGKPVRLVQPPSLGFAYMGMNMGSPSGGAGGHPVFSDAAVRRALSMAVDRRAMLRNVFDTLGRLARGPFTIAHTSADTTLALPSYDVAHAAALLDSAGWRAGADGVRAKGGRRLAFSLLVPSSSKARMDYAVLLQQAFKQVGADVRLETLDHGTFLQRQRDHRFDAALAAVSPDPHATGLRQYWTSGAQENYFGYRNPRFDALLDSADASYDPATAKRFVRRAYEIMIADAPAIWLYEIASTAAIHQRIRTAPMRADLWWAHLADWWIPAGERIPRDRIGLGGSVATGAGASAAAGAR